MVGEREWHNETTLHPAGLFAVLVLGIATLLLPRRYAIFPLILMACFIPSAQRLVLMGVDLNLLRILVLFAWARLTLRSEFKGFSWNLLDTLIVGWMISGTLINTLQYGTQSAFINRCGWMFDGLGMYFFFRCVLRDWQDLNRLVLGFIIISIPAVIAFAIESQTGRNMFSVFGGVPEVTKIRDGRLRCQGAFSHAILAGCFWASVIPWMMAYFATGKKLLAGIGILACLMIVVACASSTPVMAVIFVAVGMAFYPLRSHLRYFRWGFFASLALLHLIMAAPVWHLIARVNVVGGSTGWHRYRIMDATINNFPEWWLLGERDPMSWGVWEMRDITNQYILEALRGGLLTLILFIGGIVAAFGIVGRILRTVNELAQKRLLVYTLGASLFAHVWIYFSVSYFGQIIMLWYLNLAMIASLSQILSTTNSDPGPLPNQHNRESFREALDFEMSGTLTRERATNGMS